MDSIKDQLVSAYNRHADERDAAARQPWKISERDEFFQALRQRNLHSVLEIGSGPGHDGKIFQDCGLDVMCIDLSPNMIALCQQKGLRAQVMDFSRLSFPDSSFDAVWALNCLLHVPKADLPLVLAEIRRVLKPGGLFYMGVYGRQNWEGIWEGDNYEPKRFFSFLDEPTLRGTLSPFFTILSFKTLPHSDVLDFQSIRMINDEESAPC